MGQEAPRGSDVGLRDQLSRLQGLLVLSRMMTESADEGQIIDIVAETLPSLGQSALQGVYLQQVGWRATVGALDEPLTRASLVDQREALAPSGGRNVLPGVVWTGLYPLRSLDGDFGFVVIGADADPGPSEKFLLRVLVQQMAMALTNSDLLSRERTRLQEFVATNVALAETVAALERSTSIHERLTQVALSGLGESGIAEAVHELTGFAVAVEDRYGNLRAWAGPDQPEPYPKDNPATRERLLKEAIEQEHPMAVGSTMIAVARARSDVMGVLVLHVAPGMAGPAEIVVLEHGATVLAMELSRLRSLAEIELRLRRDLVDELLAGTDVASALARGDALGYDLQRPHRVVVVEGHDGTLRDGELYFEAVRRAARDTGVGTLLVSRGAVVVVISDAPEEANSNWHAFRSAVLRESGAANCRIGVGSPCEVPADFPRSYRDALYALRIQRSVGGDQVTFFDDLGVYRLLAAVEEPSRVERFVREWLGDLLDYDGQKGSELVLTLTRYLAHAGSYNETAKALSVHRSTLKYRLQRIREITGRDLGDPETSFNLQLATRAWQTLAAIKSETT